MNYRRLGRSGLKLSELSFGSWVSFHTKFGVDTAAEIMAAAYEAGVNFFDNAESYAGGKSEEVMGAALKKLGWRRASYVISTKFYWGLNDGPNEKNTLNRKYLLQAVEGSLRRLGLDYVDLVFCHRPDADTPVEETVWAMHDIVSQGKALYWGTSEWPAAQIVQAWQIAERHHLHKPVTEQPKYNLFARERFEREYGPVFRDLGYGATTFSPIGGGLLSGKYNDGIPAGSRAADFDWFKGSLTPDKIEMVKQLGALAAELGGTAAQLALAWCLKNPNVSTVITGATRVSQVHENLKAAEFAAKLTPEVMERIEAIVNNRPADWRAV